MIGFDRTDAERSRVSNEELLKYRASIDDYRRSDEFLVEEERGSLRCITKEKWVLLKVDKEIAERMKLMFWLTLRARKLLILMKVCLISVCLPFFRGYQKLIGQICGIVLKVQLGP